MFYAQLNQMKRMLGQLERWLDALSVYAKARPFDPNVLMTMRLAPDQLAFARQVQIACDTAKYAAARLTGKEAPPTADDEQTIEQLRARIRWTIAHLDGYTPNDFDASATRIVSQPRWEGRVMLGADYFVEHATPNFYFHVTHAYAILRHNGVPLGKADFLGALSLRQP